VTRVSVVRVDARVVSGGRARSIRVDADASPRAERRFVGRGGVPSLSESARREDLARGRRRRRGGRGRRYREIRREAISRGDVRQELNALRVVVRHRAPRRAILARTCERRSF
jgi:hypothetical protein